MKENVIKLSEIKKEYKRRTRKPGTGKVKAVKEEATPREKRYVDNVLEGKSQTDAIIDAYSFGPEKKRQAASALGTLLMKRERVVKYLTQQSQGAATRIVKLSKEAKTETVQLNANKDILDRANIGVNKGPVAAVQINFGEDRIEFGGNHT